VQAVNSQGGSQRPADTEWFAPPERFGAEHDKLLLEQYKVFVESANKVSDRRSTAHTFLLTANTTLITLYGFVLGKDVALSTAKTPWAWLVPLTGFLLTCAWFLLIRSYRTLNGAKFRVIHELEKRLPARLFDLEWEFLKRGESLTHVPLTHIEEYVPAAFACLYAVLIVLALRTP
jgi:hypothetical protein